MLKTQKSCESNAGNWIYGFSPWFYVLQVIIRCLYFTWNIYTHLYSN